ETMRNAVTWHSTFTMGPLVLLVLGSFGCETAAESDATPDTNVEDTATNVDGTDGTDATDAAPAPVFCDGTTKAIYDPVGGAMLGQFPDDYYTEAADTETGMRVTLSRENAPWIDNVPGNFSNNILELNDLDGWGTTAGVFFRFTATVTGFETGAKASLENDGLLLVELTEAGARRIPFEVRYTDEQKTLMVIPLVPLRERTRHAAILTTNHRADDGKCVTPSTHLQQVLSGTATDARLAEMTTRYREMLDATGLAADDISAATVFTTQSITSEALTVAANVGASTYDWDGPADCKVVNGMRSCEASYQSNDYRADDVFVDGTPQSTWTTPTTIWLPNDDQGPYPTVVFGHGIGGQRSQGRYFAEFLTSLGIAVIAIDAVAHGEHPGGSGGSTQLDIAKFFGINIATQAINGRVLRDNFRQSAWDKLQLITLLQDDADVNGDGKDDIDVERLAYLGVSLGGIMGPEVMALTDRLGAGVLEICGGRLTTIMTDSEQFGGFIGLLVPSGTEPGTIDRFFLMAQTLMERGDPANWGPFILNERLPSTGDRTPHVLMQIAIGDETIPNSASWHLARAIGVAQLPPVIVPIDVVEQVASLPMAGNIDGEITAGVFQFDRLSFAPNGAIEAAAHGTTPGSIQAVAQNAHFLQTWYAGETPEIIDTYEQYSTPPLP
ncbi:MAG: dienelactone hydrolase, partial [Myxococcota bacterium]